MKVSGTGRGVNPRNRLDAKQALMDADASEIDDEGDSDCW